MSHIDIHELKLLLQHHLGDGLVVVVGSGLSCAEGLPSMQDIADHLERTIESHLSPEDTNLWNQIRPLIRKCGLESALLAIAPSLSLEEIIASSACDLVLNAERKVIAEVFGGHRVLQFTILVKELLKPQMGLPILTTNYDRLIETACEEAGLGVDTMFVGYFAGELNENESRISFLREVKLQGSIVRRRFRERANVYKPHGSLDWYERCGRPVRHSGDLNIPRLVITPGLNKFKDGYESPFDRHREKANRAIDTASRFLIIGYGFNDDHLQTHLSPMITSGKPTLILTKRLSPRAVSLASDHSNVIALDQKDDGKMTDTRLFLDRKEFTLENLSLWNVKDFVIEVLKP